MFKAVGRNVLHGASNFKRHATAVLTVVESAAQADAERIQSFMNNPENSEGNYKMYVMKTIRS
jgi:hypothetical protein